MENLKKLMTLTFNTHLIQDWNCCTPESPCKTENTGDCDDHGDCHGDMLCGTNNCGADDVTGFGKIVATDENI